MIDVPKLASSYRRLVLWFGGQLVVGCGGNLLSPLVYASSGGVDPWPLFTLVSLCTLAALSYYGGRTAAALGSTVPWLWGAAMFVPCANAITLLVLSHRATVACRANGIPVGFFGPRISPSEGASDETANDETASDQTE